MSDSEEELLKQREKLKEKKKRESKLSDDKKKRKHSDLNNSSESTKPTPSPGVDEEKKDHKKKKTKVISSQDSPIETTPPKSSKKAEKSDASSSKKSSKTEVVDTVQEMELETSTSVSSSTSQKDKINFTFQKPQPETALPYIVHFPQGIPPEVANNPDEEIKIQSFRNAEKRKQHQYSVICETSTMQYTGKNFGSEAQRENLSKYVIGIYNKKTGKVKMVEAQGMFAMSQKIKNAVVSLSVDNSLQSLSNAQKKLELVTAFGSKRLQKSYIRVWKFYFFPEYFRTMEVFWTKQPNLLENLIYWIFYKLKMMSTSRWFKNQMLEIYIQIFLLPISRLKIIRKSICLRR